MARDEGEGFLSRWSRLKKQVRETEKAPERTQDEAPVQSKVLPAERPATPAAPPPELPPIESLKGLASEYAEFLKPGVDDNLRRAALKKLFRDPYFDTFERFEAYCEDYTKGEAISPAVLRTLAHAKRLLFDEKKEDAKDGEVSGAQPSAQAEVRADAPPGSPEDKT